MQIQIIEIDQVQISKRLRSLDTEKIDALAESMEVIGLQQPISVWAPNSETLDLVAGLHRLEAARKLGWEDIDCIFVNMDDLDRQLWEIDENLCRADLSPAEMAEHLKRRKKLWEERGEREKKVAQVEPPSGQKKGFAKDTEDKTGTSKATINRAIARAEAIPADVFGKIQGTELDKGTYLDKLKKLSHEEQRDMVEHDVLSERKRKSRRTSTEIRLDKFDYAVRHFVGTLSLLHLIDVPPLDAGQLSQVETDLRNARKALSKFIKTVRRAHDENQAS